MPTSARLWSVPPVPRNSQQQILQKSLQDLLNAERRWRKRAEQESAAFRQLLEWLAYQIGGGELVDAARRVDPKAYKQWGAEEWRRLFESVLEHKTQSRWRPAALPPKPQSQEKPKPPQPQPQRKAQEQAQEEKPQQMEREPQRKVETQEQEAQKKAEATAAVTAVGISALVDALKAVPWRELDTPSMYATLARNGGKRWKRGLMMVYLIATQGINSRMEMAAVFSQAFGKSLATTRAWVRRAGEFMVARNFLVSKRLQMSEPKTSLGVYVLSEEGRRLAERMGWNVVESEVERIERLHEGKRFPAHTLGILTFALHARLRGWAVRVLPEHETATPPDVLVERDGQRLFVEVELSKKEHVAKWRNNAAMNGGRVALVAATADRRRALVADVKRLKLPGVAADLQGYIEAPVGEITPDVPLWFEEW
ncbi:MAG TPA: hypothetical protein ENJ54_00135 [Chloroflexi bacterium]|nr:hypothetical protein [Chloroflexota bacterium]